MRSYSLRNLMNKIYNNIFFLFKYINMAAAMAALPALAPMAERSQSRMGKLLANIVCFIILLAGIIVLSSSNYLPGFLLFLTGGAGIYWFNKESLFMGGNDDDEDLFEETTENNNSLQDYRELFSKLMLSGENLVTVLDYKNKLIESTEIQDRLNDMHDSLKMDIKMLIKKINDPDITALFDFQ